MVFKQVTQCDNLTILVDTVGGGELHVLTRFTHALWTNKKAYPGNHLITKILLELKSLPLKHEVVLHWNEE